MNLEIKHNTLTAEEFIELWESVWGDVPSLEQTRLAMARMLGDMGLDYYIKDVVVKPEYQHLGIGRMLINELFKYINDNGVSGTGIFVELCAAPDKMAFYERFGFSSNEAQRMQLMYEVKSK